MTATYKKQALLTGAGVMHLQFMSKEDQPTTAPTYAEEVYATPSLSKIAVTLDIAEKKVYLSNLLHTDLSAVKSANIVIDAGYLPSGFAEEAQGMVKVGEGWSMPTQLTKKPFRLAIPLTDEFGDQYIINFPKATLSPVDISGETSGEDVNEQLKQFNINAKPLVYKVKDMNFVYFTMDLAVPENKEKYDANKLLELGWFDDQTLAKCTKASVPGA